MLQYDLFATNEVISMANEEQAEFKIGLIGEYLVRLRLNEYGINTGTVDKDTGTDIIMFYGHHILTAQVKTGRTEWNYGNPHNVDIHFMVNLNWQNGDNLLLDNVDILWKRAGDEGVGRIFDRGSIDEIFI